LWALPGKKPGKIDAERKTQIQGVGAVFLTNATTLFNCHCFCFLNQPSEENTMGNNTSPLESLAAFAIAFTLGALATGGLGAYIAKLKRDAKKS
jgi:hypothetical protein